MAILLDPLGNYFMLSGQSVAADLGPETIALPGTYTLTVYGNGTATGNYAFDLRTASSAAALATNNTETTGTLATGLTTDLYSFTGTAGQRLDIQSLLGNPTNGAYYYVYQPDNANITSNYTDLANGNRDVLLTETGTYLLAVVGQSESNASVMYGLTATLSTPTTLPLSLNSVTTGTIPLPGAQQDYTFTGTVGQRLLFDGLVAAGNFTIEIDDPAGTDIFFNSLNGYNPGITLGTPGTYKVIITGSGATTGSYSFQLLDLASAAPITVNNVVADTLVNGRTTKLYSFSASAGQALFMQGLSDQVSAGAYYEVIAPDNTVTGVQQYTENNAGPLTLTETGTYVVAVVAQSFTNVSNTFSVEPWLSTPAVDALTLNTVTNGTLPQPGTLHDYTFTGAPGQRLYLDGQSADSNLYGELIGPNGAGVFGFVPLTNDFIPIPALTLPGTYTLRVEGSGTATGAYSFQLLDAATQPVITLGAGEAVFNVTLSAASPSPVTVQYATSDGTATQNEDYRAATGVLTFAANQTSLAVPVQLLNDGVIPAAGFETFLLNLSNPTGATIARTPATATIVEGPTDSITDFTGTAPATGTILFPFTVSLSKPVNVQVTVAFATADGTASASAGDYVAASGTVTFAAGATTATINITVNGNHPAGANKTFFVNLSNPTFSVLASLIGGKSQGVGTIQYLSNGGSVSGTVYNDVNGNGARDAGDNGLANWTVNVLNGSTIVATGTTANDGTYTISNVQPGTYTLAEVVEGGYVETAPGAPGTYSIVIPSGGSVTGKDFGDFKTVSVNGTVFNDLNKDGVKQAGEPGLPSWEVEAVNNSNSATYAAFTDSNGNYSITGVGPGTYTVSQFIMPNFVQTAPTPVPPGTYTVTTSSGTDVSGELFGDYQTVTVNAESTLPNSTYGQSVSFTVTVAPPSGGATPTGNVQFVVDGANFGGTVALVNGAATSGAIATLGAGSHSVAVNYLGDTNYAAASGTFTQNVNKAHLAVVPDNLFKTVGQPNPPLTAHLTGFVLGENAGNAGVTGSPLLATTATTASPAGTYPITVISSNSLFATNYDFPTRQLRHRHPHRHPGHRPRRQRRLDTPDLDLRPVSHIHRHRRPAHRRTDPHRHRPVRRRRRELRQPRRPGERRGHQRCHRHPRRRHPHGRRQLPGRHQLRRGLGQLHPGRQQGAPRRRPRQPHQDGRPAQPHAHRPLHRLRPRRERRHRGRHRHAVAATTATSASPVGAYPITVNSAGSLARHNYDFPTASFGTGTLTVTQGTVLAVTVGSTLPISTYGQSVSFTVIVAPPTGGPTPTGSVQFVVDGVNFGSAVALVNGAATSGAIATLGAGNHSVAANYLGDTNYAATTSGNLHPDRQQGAPRRRPRQPHQVRRPAQPARSPPTSPASSSARTPATADVTGSPDPRHHRHHRQPRRHVSDHRQLAPATLARQQLRLPRRQLRPAP